jgi:hypothetical protein
MDAQAGQVLTTRLRAVVLGLGITAALLGAFTYSASTRVHGDEACSRCGVQRAVDRRGPYWAYSNPTPSRSRAWIEANVSPCTEHTWKRVGCRLDSGMYSRYGAPELP